MSAALPILQDDTESLTQLFNSVDSGPSPAGLSRHGGIIECAKRDRLKEAERATGSRPVLKPRPDGKLTFLRVGLFGHKLFEGRILRQFGTELTWDVRAEAFKDQDFAEAVRLFVGYHKHWGSIEERWGCRILGAELPLGEGEWDAVVRAKLGGPLTGRADAIIEVTDPEKAFANTGHRLMPGRYGFDYKFSEKHGADDATTFGPDNIQAQNYLYLDTLQNGEQGALGWIFERIIGHSELRKEAVGKSSASYASFVVYPQLDSEERLRAVVRLSNLLKENGLANPLACKGAYGRPCWFKTSGACPGW